MTIRYVFSGANAGSKSGVDWNNAYTTLASATMNPGDVIYVAHTHNEVTGQSGPIVSNGTPMFPVWVYCVLMSAPPKLPTYADLRTTAKVQTFSDENISLSGTAYYYGITFTAGRLSGSPYLYLTTGNGNWNCFDTCSLRIGSTGVNGRIVSSGGYGCTVDLINTTLQFANATQFFDHSCLVRWRNTILANAVQGVIPNTLFVPSPGRAPVMECIALDLSPMGAGKTLVDNGAASFSASARYSFTGCKLNSAVTKAAAPLAHGATRIDLLRSGAAPVNSAVYVHRRSALLVEEATNLRLNGGLVSWKVTTTENCTYSSPFECPPIAFWVDTPGVPVTATIEALNSLVVASKDSEIWLDVEYLGSASSPLGSFVNDGTANLLVAPADQTVSTAGWAVAGGSKIKLSVGFTPQQKGWAYARVKIGKPSSIFYIDPIVTLT